MARIINLPTFNDDRGNLTIIEKIIPFSVKRLYYIYGVKDTNIVRGGHRHHSNHQALVCVSGSCSVYCNNGVEQQTFQLDSPSKCLDLPPEEWHTMKNFSSDCVLLVLASELYSINDYIDTPYE